MAPSSGELAGLPNDCKTSRPRVDNLTDKSSGVERLNEPVTETIAIPINVVPFRGNAKAMKFLPKVNPQLNIVEKLGHRPFALRMGKDAAAVVLLDAEPKERQTLESQMKAVEIEASKG